MKKLLLIAAACVALAGCANNEIDTLEQQGEQIGYQTVLSLQQNNRAEMTAFTTSDTFVASGWVVPAGNTYPTGAGLYIDRQTVVYGTYMASTWTTATAYYWPSEGTMTFFAHSPASVASSWDGNTYTIPFDIGTTTGDAQVDLLVADVQNGRTYANSGTTGVPVAFGHKLTKVSFTAGVAKPQTGVTFALKSVVLKGVGKTSTFTQSNNGTTTTEAWATPATSDNYTVFSGDLAVSADLSIVSPTPDEVTTTKTLFIPHTFSDTASLVVTYERTTELGGVSSSVTVQKEVLLKDISTKWNINSHVTYCLSIGFVPQIIWEQPTLNAWTPETYTVSI